TSRVKIEKQIDDFEMDAGKLWPLGVIINELLTNALKYAFTGDREGVIQVIFRRKDEQILEIRVSDDGVGILEDIDINNPKGFGLTLVKMLVKQFKGKI